MLHPSRPGICLAGLAALLFWMVCPSPAWAGGGPQNVLLVVNPKSPESLAIANCYAALRKIPPVNVVYLSWDPKVGTTDVDTFRRQILVPLMEAATIAHLGRQIDYIVYSSGFPWAIRIDKDVEKFKAEMDKVIREHTPSDSKPDDSKGHDDAKEQHGDRHEHAGARFWPRFLTEVGSLNGLTYLWEPVLDGSAGYLERHANWYARWPVSAQLEKSQGFSSKFRFGPHGDVEQAGRRYMLSMVLGVSRERGNTLDEVTAYLRRSAAADGTFPKGTIYFVQNGDIRSRVRMREFPATVQSLKELGVAAEIVDGITPNEKSDVQGAMLGTMLFNWKGSKSTILPGAICDHLTSFGGIMDPCDHTSMCEFLRYGAAAASGTVTEPYAIAEKFPTAAMHVHYARGCTAAESFYQSVACPYQLLIVGDPLCRPWADVPEVQVSGVQPEATVSGALRLQPAARFAQGSTVDHFELLVEGLSLLRCPAGGTLELDTRQLVDGYHELRIVAVAAGPIATQGFRSLGIASANHNRAMTVAVTPMKNVSVKEPLRIAAKAPGCREIEVRQGTRLVARINGEAGVVEIQPAPLGTGPIRLQVIGVGGQGSLSNVLCKPLELTVVDK
jgi:hypothetical protein